VNVRDIGGYKIKQGLIYRGSDLSTNYKITESGRDMFVNKLKIKTEVELRGERGDVGKSDVDSKVLFKYLPYRPYMEIFEEKHRQGICDIMNFLSDEKNYPMYIHCLGGADRTGILHDSGHIFGCGNHDNTAVFPCALSAGFLRCFFSSVFLSKFIDKPTVWQDMPLVSFLYSLFWVFWNGWLPGSD